MEKIKSRCWVMVLYPDDPSHVECMSTLAQGGYTYAAILHDKDTWEDGENENHKAGETKKPHWHVVLRTLNPRWRDSVADELGIKPTYLERCRDRNAALLYLVHEGYSQKYQYDVNDVLGPLAVNLAKLLVDDDEGQRVVTIVNMIDQSPGRVGYREILLKACNAGLYGEFRRLGSGVKWLIDEHNEDFEKALTGNLGVQVSYDEFNEFVKWSQAFKKSGREYF